MHKELFMDQTTFLPSISITPTDDKNYEDLVKLKLINKDKTYNFPELLKYVNVVLKI